MFLNLYTNTTFLTSGGRVDGVGNNQTNLSLQQTGLFQSQSYISSMAQECVILSEEVFLICTSV